MAVMQPLPSLIQFLTLEPNLSLPFFSFDLPGLLFQANLHLTPHRAVPSSSWGLEVEPSGHNLDKETSVGALYAIMELLAYPICGRLDFAKMTSW